VPWKTWRWLPLISAEITGKVVPVETKQRKTTKRQPSLTDICTYQYWYSHLRLFSLQNQRWEARRSLDTLILTLLDLPVSTLTAVPSAIQKSQSQRLLGSWLSSSGAAESPGRRFQGNIGFGASNGNGAVFVDDLAHPGCGVDPLWKSGHVMEGHMDVGPSLFRSPLLVASDMSWMPATTTERGWREPAGA